MDTEAQLLTCGLQRRSNLKIRYSRELHRCIFQGGVVITNRACGNYHITGLNIQMNTTAGTHTDEGIGTNVVQFFHGDGCRRTADTGRTHRDLLAQQRTGVDIVLTVHTHMYRVIKMGSNGCATAGIAGQDHIATHIAFHTVNMKLLFCSLHKHHPFAMYFIEYITKSIVFQGLVFNSGRVLS